MTTAQLELGLEKPAGRPVPVRRARAPRNPGWWFQRMREIVDRAWDWQPAPPPRPEQILLPTPDFRFRTV
jgi:hypothetical protein